MISVTWCTFTCSIRDTQCLLVHLFVAVLKDLGMRLYGSGNCHSYNRDGGTDYHKLISVNFLFRSIRLLAALQCVSAVKLIHSAKASSIMFF